MIVTRFSHRLSGLIRSPRRACLQTYRKLTGSRQLVILASPHKVGSTWLYRLLLDICGYEGYQLPPQITQAHPQILPVDIDLQSILEDIQMPAGGFVFKSHSYPPDSLASTPSWIKFVTMLWDPRDVIVSASYYLANLSVEQGGWGEEFRKLDPRERIIRVIQEGDFLRKRLSAWNLFPHAHKVQYERLLADQLNELKRLLKFLELNINEERIRKICDQHTFT